MDVCGFRDIDSGFDIEGPIPMVSEKQLHRKLKLILTDTSEMAISPHRSLQRICSVIDYFMIPNSLVVRTDLSVETLETGLAMFEHNLNYLRYTIEVYDESFKPIDEPLLDKMRVQIRAINDCRHSLQRPDNEKEAKERFARINVYINDLVTILKHPATLQNSSELHREKNGFVTGNTYPTNTEPNEIPKVDKLIKKLHALHTASYLPNLPLNKTSRICERYDILKMYKFGDCKMQHHTLVLLMYLILGPACQIRLAIITITEYNQYKNLIKLLNLCKYTIDLLKAAANGHPRAFTAYLEYLDQMRLLTSNLAILCKREHTHFSSARPSKILGATATPLVHEKLCILDTASCSLEDVKETEGEDVVDFDEDYLKGNESLEYAPINRENEKYANVNAIKIDENLIDNLNQLQLNHDVDKAECGQDLNDNTDYSNYVYGYISSIAAAVATRDACVPVPLKISTHQVS